MYERKKIVDSFNKIKPDEKMKERMLSKIINSDNSTVESNLKNSIRKEFFMRKKSVVAAVVALCIMAVSGTAYAGYKCCISWCCFRSKS